MDTENGVPPKRRKNFRKNSEQKIIVDNNQRETLYETALETPMVDLKRFYVDFYGESSSFPQKNRMLTR